MKSTLTTNRLPESDFATTPRSPARGPLRISTGVPATSHPPRGSAAPVAIN